MKSLLIAALFFAPFIASASQVSGSQIKYWSLWTDAQGVSHQSQCKLDSLALQEFSVKGNPEWVSTDDMKTIRYVLNIMPTHWSGTWHKSPKPQWVIPLTGKWYIESMDKNKVVYGPGEISFGYDIKAVEKEGKIGHLSGSVGNAPARVMVIQVDSLPKNITDTRCMAGGEFLK
ncbi:hypothetical protein [Rouxiella sp. WC2420]|uniref:Cupin domain-containing protein n=1 Tax=Rouxiella sp. WC2420 TaxID=3234145 RepID=A0AB39VXG1_9GAMM